MTYDSIIQIERSLYELFDIVWAKHYKSIREGGKSSLTEAEMFVLWNAPDWLQYLGYWRQHKQEEDKK